ncbi:MAG TPA: hypothetical protein VK327_19010, partial [Candidatus Paceibacterota bacterium]|nr:hypothetical protein [Candidatus Paceibacterota bacterium]
MKGLLTVVLCLNLTAVLAQPGRPGGMGGGPRGGPSISAATAKLFGKNNEFSANIESEVRLAQGRTMSMPGKIAFDSGKSRFDMDMSEAKGTAMPPQMAAQMKTMGMDKTVSISRPDLKTTYIVFPGLKAYAVSPEQTSADAKAGEESKVETTDLGKETVDGH